ncbi:methyl-accepting chemotaxis protein [Tumebacillus permanentifrigoris]|uniref:Methyl-accepting chemotaxis protein n=1 Tax=Tumebacillus permanentifrigoris TaxID=378543 RepID=A0A316DGX2_9BACL|nr:methyl-accepting chemotaxis protein [Tumebacillus permanentifrigoris]PWK16489.1 methyl-accepting chemotaxis protein [Tumebacillus permanentifrigoris]
MGKLSIKWKLILPSLLVMTLVVACIAFLIYKETEKSLERQGLALTETVRMGMENAIVARATTEQVLEKEMIGQASMLSLLAAKGTTYEELAALSKRSGIDEFWITDEKGYTKLTNMAPKVDFNFGADANSQAYAFMDLVTQKRDVVTQPAQVRTLDNKMFKFVGVTGWNKPGIVQIGRDGKQLAELENKVGAKPLIAQMKTHLSDEVLLAAVLEQDGKAMVATDDKFKALPLDLKASYQAAIQSKQTVTLGGDLNGTPVTYYFTALTNGQGMVLALSTEILTKLRNITIIAAGVGILIITVVTMLVMAAMFKRLKELQDSLQSISRGDGDLTSRLPITTQDEFGQLAMAANQMLERLQETISDVGRAVEGFHGASAQLRATTQGVRDASHQIAEDAQIVSHEAQESDRELASMGTQIDTIAHKVDDIAASAEVTAGTTKRAEELVEEGRQTISSAQQKLEVVKLNTLSNNQVIDQLATKSDQVEGILGIISQIATQTNLLALNAAIEAARAGELGRGFAVVADEVRKLAEHAMNSTNDITVIVEDIKQEIQHIVKNRDKNNRDFEVGMEAFDTVQRVFDDITIASQEMVNHVGAITNDNQDLASQWEHIVSGTQRVQEASRRTVGNSENIAAVVEEQTAAFDEIATSAEVLAETAERLKGSIAGYRV